MRVAGFVTFQKKVPGANAADMDCKTLAAHLDKLDRLAKKQKLPALSYFWSGSPADLESLVGDKKERSDLQRQVKWLQNKVGKAAKSEHKLLKQLESAFADIEMV